MPFCPRLRTAALALTLSVACTFPRLLHAQARDSRDSKDQLFTATRQQLDVTKVLLAEEAAWNKGDMVAYLNHYKDAADTEAVLERPVRGLANIRAQFTANFPNADAMGKLEYTEVAVRGLGENFALATGRFHIERSRKSGGPLDGTFSEILEKTEAGWRVIFSDNT